MEFSRIAPPYTSDITGNTKFTAHFNCPSVPHLSPNRYAFARVASAWLVATYSLYIRARQFDSLWSLETVKRSLHCGRYEVFRTLQ